MHFLHKQFDLGRIVSDSLVMKYDAIRNRDRALSRLTKRELVEAYLLHHRVVDVKEVRKMHKNHLIGDLLRAEFGRKLCDEYFAHRA